MALTAAMYLAVYLLKPVLRTRLIGVFARLASIKSMILALVLGIYSIAVSYTLWAIGLWDHSYFKSTLIWTIGLVLLGIVDANQQHKPGMVFKNSLRSQIALVLLVVYLTALWQFGLVVEMLLPHFTVCSVAMIFFRRDAQFGNHGNTSHLLLNSFISVMGPIVLVVGLFPIWFLPANFWTIEQVRILALPIVYACLTLPFYLPLIYRVSRKN